MPSMAAMTTIMIAMTMSKSMYVLIPELYSSKPSKTFVKKGNYDQIIATKAQKGNDSRLSSDTGGSDI
jgi:hypothetical protein